MKPCYIKTSITCAYAPDMQANNSTQKFPFSRLEGITAGSQRGNFIILQCKFNYGSYSPCKVSILLLDSTSVDERQSSGSGACSP